MRRSNAKPDVRLKDFWRSNDRFADLFNAVVRARDVVKKTAYGADFVIWGIENQQRIHYASPLRTLLYDGMGYLKEYNEITRMRKEDPESKTRDEFLS